MDILMVDTCMGTIIDFIGLNTIFISFLITDICFFLLVISRTLVDSVDSMTTSAYIVKHNDIFIVEWTYVVAIYILISIMILGLKIEFEQRQTTQNRRK